MNKLNVVNGWGQAGNYYARRSAQSVMGANQMLFATAGCGSSCGSGGDAKPASACGAGDDPKPASACGAGDDPKPASACGAGDDPKPSACGSGCGASDDK